MYLQKEIYIIKNNSIDINIATHICSISFLLIDSKYFGKLRTLMRQCTGRSFNSRIAYVMTFYVREISFDDYIAMLKEFDVLRYRRIVLPGKDLSRRKR